MLLRSSVALYGAADGHTALWTVPHHKATLAHQLDSVGGLIFRPAIKLKHRTVVRERRDTGWQVDWSVQQLDLLLLGEGGRPLPLLHVGMRIWLMLSK